MKNEYMQNIRDLKTLLKRLKEQHNDSYYWRIRSIMLNLVGVTLDDCEQILDIIERYNKDDIQLIKLILNKYYHISQEELSEVDEYYNSCDIKEEDERDWQEILGKLWGGDQDSFALYCSVMKNTPEEIEKEALEESDKRMMGWLEEFGELLGIEEDDTKNVREVIQKLSGM